MTLDAFESLVLSQASAPIAWQPVTDYSYEGRVAAEGRHPDLIIETFAPSFVLDVGCGPGHLVRMLQERGVKALGCDKANYKGITRYDITSRDEFVSMAVADLVICREVLEHLTVLEIARAVRNLCLLSSRLVYVTTRFAKQPKDLLDVDTADDLDPTHISMLNQDLLRVLFVLEGFKRRADLEARIDWIQKGRALVYERA